MGLPRTFVGFSSTDITQYRLMLAWKAHEHIDFDFENCQLQEELDSENEDYIKRVCRERIKMARKYVLLIGQDTRYKYKYVRWEAEVAIEKGCTIIGVNLDKSRQYIEATCPPVIKDIGAVFVSFSPKIIALALDKYQMNAKGNYHYEDKVYKQRGLLDPLTAYFTS
jgi:NAD+--asparagine ADP-ribosyltransferase